MSNKNTSSSDITGVTCKLCGLLLSTADNRHACPNYPLLAVLSLDLTGILIAIHLTEASANLNLL